MLNGTGMHQGLLIPVLSSWLRDAQQVHSWAHFLLGLCFSLNFNVHSSVGMHLLKSSPQRQ